MWTHVKYELICEESLYTLYAFSYRMELKHMTRKEEQMKVST
jgi:hypothetical protein